MKREFLLSSEKDKNFIKIRDNNKFYYGGNQNWFKKASKISNGCGPVAGANVLAYLSQNKNAYRDLYEYEDFSKENFLKFMEDLYDYIHPKWYGLVSIEKFTKSILNYARDRNINLNYEKLNYKDINFTLQSAYSFIRNALIRNLPVVAFNLDFRKNSPFKWHWIVITGIFTDEKGERKLIVSSWGNRYIVDYKTLYGYMKFAGGLIYFY